ncbi:surface antigen [Plasmodium falciparum UGT5.1]|uniref:Surface antigen n=1 Tax=Plasmodium falciparum UGT5.1 TaxID=1237627 RepID=W7JP70_PLAFA|nr:surface antigen [Plasmodium falciparum UGT5.1]
MKLHYSKILLFCLPLNILVSLSYAHNKNKLYITPHTKSTTSRVLSECNIESSIYDKDEEIKSVKGTFDRQMSQRFEEYEEHMKDKRKKCKEQRDKNVQEIIEKDRMDKSLAQKVEKVCLRCGCALGGVAASVGIFGGLGIYGWKSAATATAMAEGAAAGKAAGEAVRIPATIDAVISGLEQMGVSILNGQPLKTFFTSTNYTNVTKIARVINSEYQTDSCLFGGSGPATDNSICTWVTEQSKSVANIRGKTFSTYESIKTGVENIVSQAETVAERAVETATDEAIQRSIGVVDAKYAICQTAIIASVVAILVIVLVMMIIYLILRYRRKKKMKKKDQYTKLLNE